MPKNWKVTKIKHTLSNLIGGVWGTEPQGNENDIYCIRVADFDYVQLTLSTYNLTLRNISPKERSKRVLRNNDLLIEKSGGGEKTPVGRTIMFDGGIPRLSVSSNFISKVSVKSDSCFPKYLLYCLNSMYQLGLTRKHIKQSTGLQNLDIDSYFQEKIPFSSLVQQAQIANFLDLKTQQIDELIRVKERKIELLGEYRASLIHQAVTKGLDPNVGMKPSGVEWIGKIPRRWKAKKLGYVSTIFKGGTPKRNVDRYFQGELPWARPVDITALKGAMYIDDTKIHISEEALGNSGARRIPVGTVLLTSRATIGETAITTVPMATNQGFANFVCNEELSNVYLAYYLRAIKDVLISLGSGSTFLEVTKRTLLGVGIPLPPLAEQTQIANFLDHKTKQIDELRSTEVQTIKLLKEYRQSLISAVVTGKIDVRNEV